MFNTLPSSTKVAINEQPVTGRGAAMNETSASTCLISQAALRLGTSGSRTIEQKVRFNLEDQSRSLSDHVDSGRRPPAEDAPAASFPTDGKEHSKRKKEAAKQKGREVTVNRRRMTCDNHADDCDDNLDCLGCDLSCLVGFDLEPLGSRALR